MSAESVDAKLARLDEKFEHLIRTHEDFNRERREAHKMLGERLDRMDQRLQRVEHAVLAANTGLKTVVKFASALTVIIGILYGALRALGLSLTIR